MRKLVLCGMALSLFGLGGCATMADSPTYAPDYAKMQAVEHAADRFGTKVVWVNVPQKKTSANGI